MSNPDQIRADIERTRANLDLDVDALADKVSPSQIAERQKEKVRSRVTDVRESIMGGVHSAQDSLSSAADSVKQGDGLSSAKSSAASTAKGHPLAVGLIAFGAGWLLSSLLPATSDEQRLAAKAKEKAAPLTEKVKEAGQSVVADLKEPAKQAAEHVKGTAQDAASTVQDEAGSAAQDVKGSAQDAKGAVQGSATDAKDEVRGTAGQAREQLRN